MAILTVALALGGCLLVLELALRLVGFTSPPYFQTDDRFGMLLRPGLNVEQTREGHAVVRINRHGWHDVERRREKPASTLRVAVIGDSFVEAFQVARESNLCSRLEEELAECLGPPRSRIEVLNFGASSFGTGQELLVYRHVVREFSPDVVLLAFFTNNDVLNNSPALEPLRSRPFFRLSDGRLILDDSFLKQPGYRIRKTLAWRALIAVATHCRAAQYLRILASRVRMPAWGGGREAASRSIENELDRAVYLPPETPDWKEAWSLTEALLLELARETSRDGVELLVATLTNGIQVHPDRAVSAAFAARLGAPDLSYSDRRIEKLCRAHGIRSVALAPAFASHARKSGEYLHGFANSGLGQGHWNEAGHALAARLLAPHLCALLRPAGQAR